MRYYPFSQHGNGFQFVSNTTRSMSDGNYKSRRHAGYTKVDWMATFSLFGREVYVERIGNTEGATLWEYVKHSAVDAELWMGRLHVVISKVGKSRNEYENHGDRREGVD